MTENFTVSAPPDPGYWNLSYSFASGHICAEARLTCTLCPEEDWHSFLDSLSLPDYQGDTERLAPIHARITGHHAQKHPEKLFVYTSVGYWIRIEDLLDMKRLAAE